jgi:hypothetical protein
MTFAKVNVLKVAHIRDEDTYSEQSGENKSRAATMQFPHVGSPMRVLKSRIDVQIVLGTLCSQLKQES